jgi:hypothetical protein
MLSSKGEIARALFVKSCSQTTATTCPLKTVSYTPADKKLVGAAADRGYR